MSDQKQAQSKSNVSAAGSPSNGPRGSERRDPRSRGIWQEGEEPFDFNLELNDIERAELGLAGSERASGSIHATTSSPSAGATSRTHSDEVAAEDEQRFTAKTTPPPAPQANGTPAFLLDTAEAVHVPPPPRLMSSRRDSAPAHPTPLSTSNPAASVDWDEVTPRSTSVAAALLSGPAPLGDSPPISSEPNTAETPSTEPTGGRRPSPSAPSTPMAAPAPSGNPPAETFNAARRMDSEPTPNATFSYSFSPSFSIDSAPITTRGTHKLRTEAHGGKRPRTWRRWAAVVLAAFTLPFAGAALITTWLDATRIETTTANASSPALYRAETPDVLDGDPGAQQASAASRPLEEPGKDINPQPSLELQAGVGAPDEVVSVTSLTAADSPMSRSNGTAAKRRTRKPASTANGLTQTTKDGEPSYRVKIPDEQKSIELRDGAHNVPIRE